MNNNSKRYIPLVIIITLIVCIITGVILSTTLSNKDDNSKNDSFLKDNIPSLNIDSELNIEDDNNIDDTTNDELQEDINNSTEGDNQSSNNESNVDDNDTASKPNNNSNGSNKPSNNGTSTNKPNSQSKPNNNNSKPNDNTNTENKPINDKPSTNEDKVENKEEDKYEDVLPNFPDPPPTPTQKELNNTYRNEIQNTYGIKIAYGEEMGSYLIGSYAPTKMTDDTTINEYLGRIETELKKYPVGFFKEMKDYGMPLTLYIVKDIPGSEISGLTDSQIYSNIIISLKESLLFETTLNHELMHYIDAYLNSKMYPNTVDTEWNLLNPPGYSYGSFNTSYDYFPSMNNNAYFFSNYSQTNYKEDRATLFGDVMTRAYKRSCYTNGYPLYSKIQLLAKQIDDGFNTVNSSTIEYWEKFL